MKKSFIIIISILFSVLAGAENTKELKNLVNGNSIKGEYIDLGMNTTLVDQCHDGEYILLYQPRHSEAMFYSSLEQGFRWKKDNRGGLFRITRMGLLNCNNTDASIKGNTPFYLTMDNLMGNHVWTRNIMACFVDDSANVAMGYRSKWNAFNGNIEFHRRNVLYAYRLSDGSALWQDTVSHNSLWGWNDIKYIPTSGNYLVLGDSIMLIDPQKGIKKAIKISTARAYKPSKQEEEKDNFRQNYMAPPYVLPNQYTGIMSNIVFHNGYIYFADSEDIYCFDEDLNILWFAQLPRQRTSEMSIRIDGNNLTILSKGLAYKNGIRQEYGKPFIGKYDANTGRQYFLKYIDIKEQIKDAYFGKGKAFILTDKGLDVVSDFENQVIKTYPKKVVGKSVEIASNAKYALDGDNLTKLESKDNNILLVGSDSIYRLFNGDEGKTVRKMAADELYNKDCGVYTNMATDDKGNVSLDVPSDLIITEKTGKVTVHIKTAFNRAFLTENILTIITKTGIFTTKL